MLNLSPNPGSLHTSTTAKHKPVIVSDDPATVPKSMWTTSGPVLRRAMTKLFDRTGLDVAHEKVHVLVRNASEELVTEVDESYTVAVNSSGVFVAANTVWGARHALDSLAQLVVSGPLTTHDSRDSKTIEILHAVVADEPQYA